MKPLEKILVLLSNKNSSDEMVREEIEKLGTTPTDAERDEILTSLKRERPTLYQKWMLETASSYM